MTLPTLRAAGALSVLALLLGGCASPEVGQDGGTTGGDDAGQDAGTDAGPTGDGGHGGDAGPSVDAGACRVPIEGAGCSQLKQVGTPVGEVQVATDPPITTAGWYPAGKFVLTAATVYTGPGGAAGPNGVSYAATLEVNGMGSIDKYEVVQRQAGCPDVSYTFSANTFGTTTTLLDMMWSCPASCAACGQPMPYSGTLTTFTVYFPLPDGSTLSQEFTVQ